MYSTEIILHKSSLPKDVVTPCDSVQLARPRARPCGPATGPELDPPAREGIGEVAPFAAIRYDAFRCGIHTVGSLCSTE